MELTPLWSVPSIDNDPDRYKEGIKLPLWRLQHVYELPGKRFCEMTLDKLFLNSRQQQLSTSQCNLYIEKDFESKRLDISVVKPFWITLCAGAYSGLKLIYYMRKALRGVERIFFTEPCKSRICSTKYFMALTLLPSIHLVQDSVRWSWKNHALRLSRNSISFLFSSPHIT